MTYRIQGLLAETFQPLFTMTDAELAAHGAVRQRADSHPGYPCRISLTDAAIGDEVILTHFEHHPAASPYRSSHAIYVRRGEHRYDAVDEIPALLRTRLLSVRAFDRASMIIAAEVLDGTTLDGALRTMLADPRTDYVHVHFARPGCYAAQVTRA